MTIPFGWNLLIDESPPALAALIIQGSVSFDPAQDISLTATYVLVLGRGSLTAGTPSAPHPSKATIVLAGGRATPDWAIDNSLNLGSKVLAALRGGSISLHGRPVVKRWTRLAAAAAPGDANITLADLNLGWRVGDRVLIAATSFNTWQAEIRTITAVRTNGSVLVLDAPLAHPHSAKLRSYPGGPTVDMRAEVGLVSSNVLITAADGATTKVYEVGEYFGGRVVVHGNSTARLGHVAMTYCGQAGLTGRACVLFDRLAAVSAQPDNASVAATPNPSYLRSSALVYGMNSNVRLDGAPGVANPVDVSGNVMYEAYDIASVDVMTR